jgi:hypothetical protein
MDPTRFDRISKLFADRKLSRRTALAASGAGIAAIAAGSAIATAQEASPEAAPGEGFDIADKIPFLFVQSFQSGSIVPTEGVEGRFTVTLDHGLDQTIYFSDRPSRDVGSLPTEEFLGGLGFQEDNPPNAAMLLETAEGATDIAVVELFNPVYDPAGPSVTYDVAVLENWQDDIDVGLRQAPADLAAVAADFGTAHLLIDDCPSNLEVICNGPGGGNSSSGNFLVDSCWNYSVCLPCEPYGHNQPDRCATQHYWTQQCNNTYDACNGGCGASFNWYFATAEC